MYSKGSKYTSYLKDTKSLPPIQLQDNIVSFSILYCLENPMDGGAW